jgi:hypothetical protein
VSRVVNSQSLHFIPTSASWLNLVERWFAELTTKKLRRCTHTSVRQLNTCLNSTPRPFWIGEALRLDGVVHLLARHIGAGRVQASLHDGVRTNLTPVACHDHSLSLGREPVHVASLSDRIVLLVQLFQWPPCPRQAEGSPAAAGRRRTDERN